MDAIKNVIFWLKNKRLHIQKTHHIPNKVNENDIYLTVTHTHLSVSRTGIQPEKIRLYLQRKKNSESLRFSFATLNDSRQKK